MKKGQVGIIIIILALLIVGAGLLELSEGGHIGSASAPWNRFLAQVGVAVGVAPNPYNTLNEQLDAKQRELDMQAADLAAREAALSSGSAGSGTASVGGDMAILGYLAVAVGILAFFVGLNFYLDWRREKREKKEKFAAAMPIAGRPVDDIEPPITPGRPGA